MIIDASTPTSVMAGRSIAGVAVGMTTALAIWQIVGIHSTTQQASLISQV